MRGRLPVPATVALTLIAVLPATASASFTVGSSLRQRANLYVRCVATCTELQTARPGNTALKIPIDGVLTRWRLRAATLGIVRLRVLRPLPDGSYLTIGTGDPQKLAQNHVPGEDVRYTFDARITVQTGDQIALDRSPSAGGVFHSYGQDASYSAPTFPAAPGSGKPVTPPPAAIGRELLLNADIERDGDGDGFGDETQDNCPQTANDQTSNPCPEGTGPATPAPPPPSGPETVGGGTGSGSAGPPVSGEPAGSRDPRGHGGRPAPRLDPNAREPGPSSHDAGKPLREEPVASGTDTESHTRRQQTRPDPQASGPNASHHGGHPTRPTPAASGTGKSGHDTQPAPRKTPHGTPGSPTKPHGDHQPARSDPQQPNTPGWEPHTR